MINAIAIDDEPLALKVVNSLCSKIEGVTLLATFTQPTEGLAYLSAHEGIDLVFLDINMPSISGINLAKKLTRSEMIIFTTAYSDYAVESYDLNAIDYLLKPISLQRFELAIKKAITFSDYKKQEAEKSIQPTEKHYDIFVRSSYSLVKINTAEISLLEGMADYIKIHTDNKKLTVTRMTMRDIWDKLPKKEFIRVNRSVILPIHAILSIRNKTVYTRDKSYTIGVTYQDDFKQLIDSLN